MTRGPIATQHASGRSLQLSGESLINLWIEPGPQGGRSPATLIGAPNAKAFASGMDSGPIRAMIDALGYVWALSAGTVYYIDSAGTATAAGGITVDTTGWACMATDGETVAITANRSGYVISGQAASGTLTLTGNAVDAETVIIGSTTYTWRTAITAAAYDVLIGASASASLDNLISAINRTGAAGIAYSEATTRHTSVSAAPGAGDTMVVTALTAGVSGNTIATTETMTNGSFGAATLGAGVNFTVSAITDPDFPGATSVDFADGYMLFTTPDSGQWFISDLYDSGTYDALDFTTAEAAPDNNVRLIVDHGEVLIFGEKSIEPYSNQGAADFPFVRVPGGRIERGCAAKASVAKMDNSVFFVGDDRIVYRLDRYNPVKISTPELDHALDIATASEVGDAEAWTYLKSGHHVYVLSFGEQTWCYDAQTQKWHRRASGSAADQRWRCQWGVMAFGKMLVGDSEGGNVGELDLATHTDFGQTRRCVARTPNLYADGAIARMSTIELEAEMGVGLSTGQGSDPQVMMRTSDDGGKTWSPERWAGLGKIGQTRQRARWHRCGSFRQRTVEFAVSDPVDVILFGWRHETVGGVVT